MSRSRDDDQPAQSPYLITAPSAAERQYQLCVVVPLRAQRRYVLQPWLRIRANCETDDVWCAAGIRATRHGQEEDGA